jgi:putative transposase
MTMIRTYMIPCKLPKAEADALNQASGHIYTRTMVAHYRVYRRKRRWLSPYTGRRLCDHMTRDERPLLHAHSKDAAQLAFYNACKTAKANRSDGAHYPHKRKKWRTTIWRASAIRDRGDHLLLSRARGLPPVRMRLPDTLPSRTARDIREVRLVWDRVARHYTWHLVMETGIAPKSAPGTNTVAVDLGEIHPAAITDGQQTTIVTARVLRSQRQYLAKRLADLQSAQAHTKRGSRRWKRLQRVKTHFRAKQRRRIRDIEHKVSRAVVDFAVERKAGTIAVGDVRDVADGKRLAAKSQQKISTWAHGRMRQYITYKAEAEGMRIVLVDEHYSSQTCPCCQQRHKPRGRLYTCGRCGFRGHRDGVGAVNLLSRHLHGAVGRIRPPEETKYRRPAIVIDKRSLRSCRDTGQPLTAVAWDASPAGGTPQEAAGL